jgi:hypothetical protein
VESDVFYRKEWVNKLEKYISYAGCGFCKHFGKRFNNLDEDVCFDCEVRIIREYLEDLKSKITFDHDHQYRKDDEDHVRNCAHCEFGRTYETRYEVDTSNGDVWCKLKGNTEIGPATNKGSECCENWQRAKSVA